MYNGLNGNNIYHFISEKGSKITFLFKPVGVDKNMEKIAIRVNEKSGKILSNCKKTKFFNNEYIVSFCDINENELNYFYDYSTKKEYKLLLQSLCNIYKDQEICI